MMEEFERVEFRVRLLAAQLWLSAMIAHVVTQMQVIQANATKSFLDVRGQDQLLRLRHVRCLIIKLNPKVYNHGCGSYQQLLPRSCWKPDGGISSEPWLGTRS